MTVQLRAATRDDAADMATLVNMAGEGLPRSLWARRADFGQDPMEIGIAQSRDDSGPFSWVNTTIAELSGDVAGLLISSAIGSEVTEMDSDTHPVYRPILRLENMALDTRCVHVLATQPNLRKMGIAEGLIAQVEKNPGKRGLSAIVADKNAAGRAFYEQQGYREVARLPMIHGDWQTPNTAWILFKKP